MAVFAAMVMKGAFVCALCVVESSARAGSAQDRYGRIGYALWRKQCSIAAVSLRIGLALRGDVRCRYSIKRSSWKQKIASISIPKESVSGVDDNAAILEMSMMAKRRNIIYIHPRGVLMGYSNVNSLCEYLETRWEAAVQQVVIDDEIAMVFALKVNIK